jgi:hypothetical protein
MNLTYSRFEVDVAKQPSRPLVRTPHNSAPHHHVETESHHDPDGRTFGDIILDGN